MRGIRWKGECGTTTRRANMDWSQLFTPDTTAVYITFIGTVLVTSIGWIVANRLSKKKPNVIRVSRNSATSLLEIPVKIRNNIRVTYNNNEVPAVFQTQFEIHNLGEDVLENISFSIRHEKGKVFDVIIEDPLSSSRQSNFKIDDLDVRIKLAFINPYSTLKDVIKVTVLSEEEITDLTCAGGGKAWRTDYVDVLELKTNYVNLMAKANPRNPIWIYEYFSSSINVLTKLLK
jgi:hypothetical protein